VVAPHKRAYLRGHWLTAVSLLLPALRVFRLVRLVRLLQATRVARSLSMVRLLTSLNRGMGALRLTLGRHGIGFVLGLTVAVVFAGAAGMRYFESPSGGAGPGVTGLPSYGDAVWWTAMTLTTLGAAYTPQTVAGRVLAFLLALYGLGVFGYLTATFAGFFIGQDVREAAPPDPAAGLRREVAALRRQVAALTAAIERDLPARDG